MNADWCSTLRRCTLLQCSAYLLRVRGHNSHMPWLPPPFNEKGLLHNHCAARGWAKVVVVPPGANLGEGKTIGITVD